MARGPIPDFPADRPTVPEAITLASHYYAQDGNGSGGSLHIVLDDGNIADHHVEFCLQYAIDRGDEIGAALANVLLKMTPTQRKAVYDSYDEYSI